VPGGLPIDPRPRRYRPGPVAVSPIRTAGGPLRGYTPAPWLQAVAQPPSVRQQTALGDFQAAPWLVRYPNGYPRSAGMGEYVATPWLTSYINGRPMARVPNGCMLLRKSDLVNAALSQCMKGKGKNKGLGDNGDGTDTTAGNQ
jgi:hypothetical protein